VENGKEDGQWYALGRRKKKGSVPGKKKRTGSEKVRHISVMNEKIVSVGKGGTWGGGAWLRSFPRKLIRSN